MTLKYDEKALLRLLPIFDDCLQESANGKVGLNQSTCSPKDII